MPTTATCAARIAAAPVDAVEALQPAEAALEVGGFVEVRSCRRRAT